MPWAAAARTSSSSVEYAWREKSVWQCVSQRICLPGVGRGAGATSAGAAAGPAAFTRGWPRPNDARGEAWYASQAAASFSTARSFSPGRSHTLRVRTIPVRSPKKMQSPQVFPDVRDVMLGPPPGRFMCGGRTPGVGVRPPRTLTCSFQPASSMRAWSSRWSRSSRSSQCAPNPCSQSYRTGRAGARGTLRARRTRWRRAPEP